MEDTVFKTPDGWRFIDDEEKHQLMLQNRVVFFAALAKTSVVSVRVNYSGFVGISFEIEFLDKDAENVELDGNIELNDFCSGGKRTNLTAENPEGVFKAGTFVQRRLFPWGKAAEGIADDELSDRYRSWWKDDGSEGEMEFFVADERIEWEHRKYFTDFETYQHTLEMPPK
jgi:hypothetical protein